MHSTYANPRGICRANNHLSIHMMQTFSHYSASQLAMKAEQTWKGVFYPPQKVFSDLPSFLRFQKNRNMISNYLNYYDFKNYIFFKKLFNTAPAYVQKAAKSKKKRSKI